MATFDDATSSLDPEAHHVTIEAIRQAIEEGMQAAAILERVRIELNLLEKNGGITPENRKILSERMMGPSGLSESVIDVYGAALILLRDLDQREEMLYELREMRRARKRAANP